MEIVTTPKIQYFEGGLKNSYIRERMGGSSLPRFSQWAVCLLINILRLDALKQQRGNFTDLGPPSW